MSFKTLLRSRAVAPTATALAAGTIIFFPRTTLHAETGDLSQTRKPIYDDEQILPQRPSPAKPSQIIATSPSSVRTHTSPTDRLAVQIGKSRLFIYAHIAAAEAKINSAMDSFLDLENSFTGTIASLAPPPASGEKLVPGSLYVLVAAMAGSIITRNRNILLRGSVPLAVGIGAGWVVLPTTMRNISDLLWKYEKKFPVVADTHLRTSESVQRAWNMTRMHSRQATVFVDEKISQGREVVEDWVKKGK